MANLKTISDACDNLIESAWSMRRSAAIMRSVAATGRNNTAKIDGVRLRLLETLARNREIIACLDQTERACREAREAMERNVNALRQAKAHFADTHREAPRPRAPATPMVSGFNLNDWKPTGESH